MKCRILFSRKNEKNISLSSAELSHSIVSINIGPDKVKSTYIFLTSLRKHMLWVLIRDT